MKYHKSLDPKFICDFTREASRLLKAVRCVQTLGEHIPVGCPMPDNITLPKRPYDLELAWMAKDAEQAIRLRSRIAAAFEFHTKWHVDLSDGGKSLIYRSRVQVGGKSTLNIIFRIKTEE